MNKLSHLVFSFAVVMFLSACAQTPDYKVAALIADRIDAQEQDIAAKVKAEKAFAEAITKEAKDAAKWNVSLESEINLLRRVQAFVDLALTERLGVPRLALQDFLRDHNKERRIAAAQSAADIAAEEERLAVNFEKIVFQRQKWREARAAILKLARKKSSEERWKELLQNGEQTWEAYNKLKKLEQESL